MGWSPLGTQFCLELAFGVFVALLFVHRAPLGPFFFRLMGTAALVPVLLAVVIPLLGRPAAEWLDPSSPTAAITLGGGLAILSYPVYAGPLRVRRRLVGLVLAAVGTGVALVHTVRSAAGVADGLDWAVASLSALATGCVAGSVGLAMVLGHWYLTIPDLKVGHLVRMNRVTLACMGLCLATVALSYLVFLQGEPAHSTRFDLWGRFYLGTRVTVGLLMPMLFGWMTAQSLRHSNTRSATGILYASTVLVLIGTAVSISLQDSYGVPL
jgi:hypothetical protein